MASLGAELLGIDDGDRTRETAAPRSSTKAAPVTRHEFQQALDYLGIKDETAKVTPGGEVVGPSGRPRVAITRPPSVRDRLPDPLKKAVGYLDQMAEGVPLLTPLADKAAAAVAATTQGFGQPEPNPYGENWLDRYTSGLEKSRSTSRQFANDNPVTSAVANVAGGIGATIPMAMTAPGALLLGLRGPSLGLKTVAGTMGGAGIGGADAALRGEDAGTGAMLGGIFGGAGPVAGEIAHKGGSAALNYMFPRTGALQNVDPVNINRLVAATQGETPASIAAAKDRVGPNAFLGDVLDGMTDLAGAGAVTPGPIKSTIREAYQTRANAQPGRLNTALDSTMGPRVDMTELNHLTTEAQKAAASPLYDQWVSMKVPPSAALKDMIPRLKEAGAFKRAEKLAGISGEPVNIKYFTGGPQKDFPTAQTWDYVKQGLDSKIDAAYSSGDKTMARKLVNLKHDMIREIEGTAAGKVWNQARKTFADYASLLDNQAAGRDTFLGGRSGTTVDEFRHELQTLSNPEIQARITGARAAVSEAIGATLQGDSKTRNMLLAPNNQEKLKVLLGPKKAGEIIKTLEQEHLLSAKTLDVLGLNSTGSSNVARSERKNMLMPNQAEPWGFDLQKPGTWLPPAIRNEFSMAGMTNARRGDQFSRANNQLGDILTMPNDPQMDNLLVALRNEAARQSLVNGRTAQGGNLLSGAISGPGASLARRQLLPTQ